MTQPNHQRRAVLKSLALGAGVATSGASLTGCAQGFEFSHGVASGDPLQDRVILWTRVVPVAAEFLSRDITLNWQVALDAGFQQLVREGQGQTNSQRDFTFKVDVTGLQADTHYYYRFSVVNRFSAVGQTKTLPMGAVEQVRFAVVSCASFAHGFFNVYREMAGHRFDYVLHLGDYIYEYGPGEYDDADKVAAQRVLQPPRELLNLNDYRTRYAQYRADPNLRRLHGLKAFICVPDDHEVANDAWREGAQNHNEPSSPNEGDYLQRRQQALQAYYEWMPIRETEDQLQLYRKFEFGDLLSLYMLDTRHRGRDPQLSHLDFVNNVFVNYDTVAADAAIKNPQRTLLGAEQKQWLLDQLANSQSRWQVFAQQVLMGRMQVPWRLATFFEVGLDLFDDGNLAELFNDELQAPADLTLLGKLMVAYNLDAWDGYYAERETLLRFIKSLGHNFINLAGDTHNAWANDLTTEDGEQVGVEFATASISSPGIADFLTGVPFLSHSFTQLIEHLRYANVYDRGFLILDVNHQRSQAHWVYVNSVKSPLYFRKFFVEKYLEVKSGAGQGRIQEVLTKSAPMDRARAAQRDEDQAML